MPDKCCPTCGQTLPPDSAIQFRGHKKTIYEAVLRAGQHGIDSERLFELLYAHDPDGGPLYGKRVMYVEVRKINQTLRPLGKEIRATALGRGGASYVLTSTNCYWRGKAK